MSRKIRKKNHCFNIECDYKKNISFRCKQKRKGRKKGHTPKECFQCW